MWLYLPINIVPFLLPELFHGSGLRTGLAKLGGLAAAYKHVIMENYAEGTLWQSSISVDATGADCSWCQAFLKVSDGLLRAYTTE